LEKPRKTDMPQHVRIGAHKTIRLMGDLSATEVTYERDKLHLFDQEMPCQFSLMEYFHSEWVFQ
jgi:hypothetical protein